MYKIYPPSSGNVRLGEKAVIEEVDQLMLSDDPVWFGRVGGNDANIVVRNLAGFGFEPSYIAALKQYPGYFDKKNSEENLIKFCEMYIESISQMDFSFVSVPHMQDMLAGTLHPYWVALHDFIPTEKCGFTNHYYIVLIRSFLSSFQKWGVGKKILIVSPFSESIKYQTQPDRIHNLFKSKDMFFPECEFITYNSPVTYNIDGVTNPYFDEVTKGVDNWFDMCEKMYNDISLIDFDVAFLACGSYGMYLGDKIKTKLSKKAVYVGGILNVYFNLYGERYDAPTWNEMVNLDYQIETLENDIFPIEFKNLFTPNEGLRAYFGKKPKNR